MQVLGATTTNIPARTCKHKIHEHTVKMIGGLEFQRHTDFFFLEFSFLLLYESFTLLKNIRTSLAYTSMLDRGQECDGQAWVEII